jgi:cyclase
MLKKRLIPKLLIRRKQLGAGSKHVLVNTLRFSSDKFVGTPLSQAKIFDANLADELIFLDIDSKGPNDPAMLKVIKQAAEQIFVPLTVGGGVRSVEDFRILLKNGADKIAINSAAVRNPQLIKDAASEFGRQCVVVSVDYSYVPDVGARVFIDGGKVLTDHNPLIWAQMAQEHGAGEILLTCIDRDGMRSGMDLEMLRQASISLDLPVIAGGGCGTTAHFIEAFEQGYVDAVTAGTFFSFHDESPMQTRAHIKNAGIPIRIPTTPPPAR